MLCHLFFDKLFNSNYIQDVGDVNIQPEDLNRDFMRRLRPCEVKEALHRMKTKKAIGRMRFLLKFGNVLESLGLSD